MSGGVIVGGWQYVWAAYGLSSLILAVYVVSVIVRFRGERQRAENEARRGPEVN
jgi:heme exporter protein D